MKRSLPPEENWDMVANPDKYIDTLPEPYRSINECLMELIIKPVFNKITQIEERRKTPEYEGNVKEVQATGQVDLNGVTAMANISKTVLSGGLLEKVSASSNGAFSTTTKSHVTSKVVIGDKFGTIHLLDVSRKLLLAKVDIEKFHGRRITSIATACLDWVDTRLIYVAVVARASPYVTIFCFKNNETKIYPLYTINICPEIENPLLLEDNNE